MATERESSVRRAIEVFLTLATDKALLNGGLGVQDITELLGREKSQVSRTLQTLAEYGLVDRHPDTRAYHLGWRTYALGLLAGQKRLLDAARPLLVRLVTATGERAHLSVLQSTNVLTVLSEAPPHALQAVDWVGRAVPAYCTSTARALMFDYGKVDVERLFQNTSLRPLGPNTVSSIDELWARLEVDRARGFAVADAEFEPGLVAVAAPVREAGGRIVAAINVSGPTFRLGPLLKGAGVEVVSAAAELAEVMGQPPAQRPHSSDGRTATQGI
jgi:DNA-binding IclR family transcriptional regulator